jgi:hypothetical protein
MSEEKNWHERLLEESDELGKKVDKLSAFLLFLAINTQPLLLPVFIP